MNEFRWETFFSPHSPCEFFELPCFVGHCVCMCKRISVAPVVATLGSYTTLQLVKQMASSRTPRSRYGWLTGASVSFGFCAVWVRISPLVSTFLDVFRFSIRFRLVSIYKRLASWGYRIFDVWMFSFIHSLILDVRVCTLSECLGSLCMKGIRKSKCLSICCEHLRACFSR